jgi:hypothetical protein
MTENPIQSPPEVPSIQAIATNFHPWISFSRGLNANIDKANLLFRDIKEIESTFYRVVKKAHPDMKFDPMKVIRHSSDYATYEHEGVTIEHTHQQIYVQVVVVLNGVVLER